jgi:hypothetical protein
LIAQCLAFAPELVKALSNGFDPEKACTAIHMCTNNTGKLSYTASLSRGKIQANINIVLICSIVRHF